MLLRASMKLRAAAAAREQPARLPAPQRARQEWPGGGSKKAKITIDSFADVTRCSAAEILANPAVQHTISVVDPSAVQSAEILIAACGPLCCDVGRVTFEKYLAGSLHGWQKLRLVDQQHTFGYGAKGTADGLALREHVNNFFAMLGLGTSEQRMYNCVYPPKTGAADEHQDEEANHFRFSCGTTEDGKPRVMGFRRMNGPLEIYYLRSDGTLLRVTAPAGVQLKMLVPSGSFVTMTGHGSGAGNSDYWHQVFAREDSATGGLIVDRWARRNEQTRMLSTSLKQLADMCKEGSIAPALSIPLSELVDFNTERLDKSEGVVISLNNYWKYCREGILTHVPNRSEKVMKSMADGKAGTLCTRCRHDGRFKPPPGVVCPEHCSPCQTGGMRRHGLDENSYKNKLLQIPAEKLRAKMLSARLDTSGNIDAMLLRVREARLERAFLVSFNLL